MSVTMQNHINITWRFIWRNMLQAKFQTTPHQIDNQGPFRVAVAIAPDNCHRRANRLQFVQNCFRANVSEVPDLVRFTCQINDSAR